MTVIEKLDLIINYLYDNENTEIDNVKIIAGLPQIDQYELTRLIGRLRDDGYVISTTIHSLSVDGYVLKETGGVKALILQKKREIAHVENERARIARVDVDLVTNTRRLNNITFWLLIVTAFVGLISLMNGMLPYILCPHKCP